tara:strand:+ start:18653 stop:18811 length:159 start_codon:yes stop_codon:yes gene_type:complete
MGMALIPHTIFNKQTELVDAEQKIVKGHIDSGYVEVFNQVVREHFIGNRAGG